MHYNFCRVHQTLRVTPAREAGVSWHVWGLAEIVSLLDAVGKSARRNVGSLLADSESDDGFFAESALGRPAYNLTDFVPMTMEGAVLGGYHLRMLVGTGGMGEVYRAHDAKLGRDVAI